jgi:hypothetical protein
MTSDSYRHLFGLSYDDATYISGFHRIVRNGSFHLVSDPQYVSTQTLTTFTVMNHSLRCLEGIAWLRTIRMGELGYPSGSDLNTLDDDNIISKFFKADKEVHDATEVEVIDVVKKVVTIVKKATSKSSHSTNVATTQI